MEETKCYAGVGSREIPSKVLDLFTEAASRLAKQGYTLRSGGARGADQAFERGCDAASGIKEIYLPWAKFEGSDSTLIVKGKQAFDMAARFHPYWCALKDGGKKLQARNCHQVLGGDLQSPSDFVLCWTRGGTGCGGTGQSVRIAKAFKIPIFDAGAFTDINECQIRLQHFLNEHGLQV